MKVEKAFSDLLLKARTNRGYTQKQVSESVSISVRWYQKLESGTRMPSALTMLRLILLLRLDVEKLREATDLVLPLSAD